ncbi:MAG TPA: dienelactone hydrolase family protein [Thermoanaerobaculia bacterium]|nr:dienelactone hydrolase family protein [Thermoanaerobaculia bacterium]
MKTTALALATTLFLVPALADDHLDRMAQEHRHDAPTASPAATMAPRGAVEDSRVAYATVEGKPITGFLARPKGAPAGAPGVVVIHEWWGLNANIESMARQLAGEGYVALAVDLYEGKAGATPEEARALAQGSQGRTAQIEDNLRGAIAYLRGTAGAKKVGVIGWCFGGGWSLRTALLAPDQIDAATIYYGRVETDPAKLGGLKSPILGIFGALDKGIPVEGVRQFEAALKAAGKSAEIHVYEGADHAFANPSGGRYKQDAAEDAWAKTLAFFGKYLR